MITELLSQSDAFQAELTDLLDSAPPMQLAHSRHESSAASALLAIEHATAARLCFAAGLPQSATAVIRLQYEAAVRAAWILYAATDSQVSVLGAELDEASDLTARKLPGASAMLGTLKENAPEGLLMPLLQFHSVAWHGLNSYVHAGLHPLRRRSEGYPMDLACQQIRNSNGLLHMTFRLLATLTGSQAAMTIITKVWEAHRACFHVSP